MRRLSGRVPRFMHSPMVRGWSGMPGHGCRRVSLMPPAERRVPRRSPLRPRGTGRDPGRIATDPAGCSPMAARSSRSWPYHGTDRGVRPRRLDPHGLAAARRHGQEDLACLSAARTQAREVAWLQAGEQGEGIPAARAARDACCPGWSWTWTDRACGYRRPGPGETNRPRPSMALPHCPRLADRQTPVRHDRRTLENLIAAPGLRHAPAPTGAMSSDRVGAASSAASVASSSTIAPAATFASAVAVWGGRASRRARRAAGQTVTEVGTRQERSLCTSQPARFGWAQGSRSGSPSRDPAALCGTGPRGGPPARGSPRGSDPPGVGESAPRCRGGASRARSSTGSSGVPWLPR